MATSFTSADYVATIGIECHVQLRTKTKLFSGADNDARDHEPNTVVSPICFGFPGVLPVLNREAIRLSIRAGVALNSQLAELSRFDRKHYFYPDLPKGYQITQLNQPIIGPGYVDIIVDGESQRVRIHHAHLEEDAGKLTHPAGADYSLVDLNRAGTPLIEIVSEADMHSPAAAKAYAQELYLLMTYAGVTAGDLYHGNMRFDVNLSVAKPGQPWGTRSETKNLNSFRSVEKAAEYEFKRQIELLQRGEVIVQETRGWDDAKQRTFSQRSKADAHDYRYFPDADLPPVRLTQEEIDREQQAMPILPPTYRAAWASLGLDPSVQVALLNVPYAARVVYGLQQAHGDQTAKRMALLFAGLASEELAMPTEESDDFFTTFHELAQMIEAHELSSNAAREIFIAMLPTGQSPRSLATEKGLLQTNDSELIGGIVATVLADPSAAQAVADVRAGNEKAIGFLVGLCMKASKGQANPAMLTTLIKEQLL